MVTVLLVSSLEAGVSRICLVYFTLRGVFLDPIGDCVPALELMLQSKRMIEHDGAMQALVTGLADASGAGELRQCGEDLIRQAQLAMRSRLQEHNSEVHDLRMELNRRPAGRAVDVSQQIVDEIDSDRQRALQRVRQLEQESADLREEVSDLRLFLALGKSLSQEEELKEILTSHGTLVTENVEVMEKSLERLRKENYELSDRLLKAQRERNEAIEERNSAIQRCQKLERIVTDLNKRLGEAVNTSPSLSASLSSIDEPDDPEPYPNSVEATSCKANHLTSRPADWNTRDTARLTLANSGGRMQSQDPRRSGQNGYHYTTLPQGNGEVFADSTGGNQYSNRAMTQEVHLHQQTDGVLRKIPSEHIYAIPDLKPKHDGTKLEDDLSEQPYSQRLVSNIMPPLPIPKDRLEWQKSSVPAPGLNLFPNTERLMNGVKPKAPHVTPYALSRGSSVPTNILSGELGRPMQHGRSRTQTESSYLRHSPEPQSANAVYSIPNKPPSAPSSSARIAGKIEAAPVQYSIPDKSLARKNRSMTSSMIGDTKPDQSAARKTTQSLRNAHTNWKSPTMQPDPLSRTFPESQL